MMPNIKKSPALGVMRREGTSAGTRKGVCENSTLQNPTRQGGGLTHGLASGTVKAPKKAERRSNRLSVLPRDGRSIAAHSACLAAGVFIGRLVHIGGIITSGTREGPAVLSADWGALLSCLFSFKSLQKAEAFHD